VNLLQRSGFAIVRQRGSPVSLQAGEFRTVVPLHDELSRGTLRGILRQCGLSRKDLERLIRR